MENTNDETVTPDDSSKQVKWDCFSCGKHLEEQGAGGSFTLHFAYGSRLDTTQGINGWVCDECVAQKHGRLRVSNGAKEGYWLEVNMVPLAEHDETKGAVENLDFYGRRKFSWKLDEEGWRLYHSVTSEERGRIEAWLFNEEPLDRDLVVKLLQAIMESEGERAKAESERWKADQIAFQRARNQAERIGAEELAELRVREAGDGLTLEETQRLWEHVLWNEDHFREQSQEIATLRDRVKELEGDNTALKKRLDRWS